MWMRSRCREHHGNTFESTALYHGRLTFRRQCQVTLRPRCRLNACAGRPCCQSHTNRHIHRARISYSQRKRLPRLHFPRRRIRLLGLLRDTGRTAPVMGFPRLLRFSSESTVVCALFRWGRRVDVVAFLVLAGEMVLPSWGSVV